MRKEVNSSKEDVMRFIEVSIPSRPRTVCPASYGATYSPLYKMYEFCNRSEADRFLADCGYTVVVEAASVNETDYFHMTGNTRRRGMSYTLRGPRGKATLEDVEVD